MRTRRQNQNWPSLSQQSQQLLRNIGGAPASVPSRIWSSLHSSTSFGLESIHHRPTHEKKRTIPLRGCNIRLWTHDGHLISHSAGLDALLQAESATVCIAHTKNGTKGAVVHHNCGRGPICPIAALTRRVANIQVGPAQGNINIVYHAGGRVSRVTDQDIGVAVRWGATLDQLTSRGYTLD
jgi:hypothetical protein